jgi:histidyl-tRNA synthetase
VWRAERPQKGRYRQFTQCDIDILGVGSAVAEVELLLATAEALTRLGLTDLTVRVNDRRLLGAIARHCGFREETQGGFFIVFDKLDKIGAEGVLGELREGGHAAAIVDRFEALLPTLQKGELSLESLPALLSGGGGDAAPAVESLAWIIRTVNHEMPAGAQARFDPTLVRGMGYYTGTIFEASSPAFPSSIAGGGRYDKLIGRMINRDVAACGFSIGFERLITILAERGTAPAAPGPAAAPRRVALLVEGTGDLAPALAAAGALRAGGDLVSVEIKRKNMGKQLESLAEQGFSAYGVVEGAGAPSLKPLAARRSRD